MDEQEAAIATAYLAMEMRRTVVLNENTPDANGRVPSGKLTDVVEVSVCLEQTPHGQRRRQF